MITIAAIASIIMYVQIKKLTKKIDTDPNDMSVYINFCDTISKELTALKSNFLQDDSLNLITKSEFDEKIDDFIKELEFTKTMNINRNDSKIWESALFSFLDKIDKFITTNTKDGEKNADELRNKLMISYNQAFKI